MCEIILMFHTATFTKTSANVINFDMKYDIMF